MKDIDLENVKVNDLVRYQRCTSSVNNYSSIIRTTKAFIILEDGAKFRKESGWGTGYHNSCCICGINDQHNHYQEDERNLYYF